MPQKQEGKRKKPDFLVYIVESPSPEDLYHKRFEGEMLTKALYLAEIPSIHKLAVNLEAFEISLTIGLQKYLSQPNASFPILHISSHGNRKGLQLTSGEVLEWHKLRDLIIPINKILNGQLVICISSCESANAFCMVMEERNTPFLVMIGHFGKPTWSDTAIAFATFYHLMGKRKLEKAIEAMKTASGDEGFGVITGEVAKIIFIEAAKKLRIQDIARELSLVRPKTPESPLEKALKKDNKRRLIMRWKVSKIIDGDTFEVSPNWKLDDKVGSIVRAKGYNAPEESRPGYEQAKEKLRMLILGKEVELKNCLVDKFGRLLCEVYYQGKNLTDYFPEYQ